METIEIGAVKIVDGEITSEFETFIKPILFPTLSKFCRSLTHITQDDVDNGIKFPEALQLFEKWCGNARLWSWGEYDNTQLRRDAGLFGLDVSFLGIAQGFVLVVQESTQVGKATMHHRQGIVDMWLRVHRNSTQGNRRR